MCGIIGYFNFEDAEKKSKNSLAHIKYRGQDNQGFFYENNCAFAHCLHAVNNFVPQPLIKNEFVFVANCEVYNWRKIYKNSRNDAEALFNFLSESNDLTDALNYVDGVYAFALWNKNIGKVFLARDILGEKPLWYYHDPDSGSFAFSSEKKSLLLEGLKKEHIKELNPRILLIYDINKKNLNQVKRDFFDVYDSVMDKEKILKYTEELLFNAIKKRIPEGKKLGLLFSGGLDSTFLAFVLKKMGVDFTCYTAALEDFNLKESEDLIWAKKVAKQLDLKLEVETVNLKDVPKILEEIVPLIEDNNVVKVGVAIPFFLAARKAKKDNVKVMFSGLGSEEIFAGYERHKNSVNINEECLSGLRKIYERDLYRDDIITMYNNIELRLPFLDLELVKFALTIPSELKLSGERNKIILREISKKIGIPEEVCERKKKAAQYGSNFDKALEKLSRAEKLSKSAYLKKFYDSGNVRLGVLLSTGKDSLLAAQIMLEQNYKIECFITLVSENKDSYMYHGPNTHIAKLQSEASGIPIIFKNTFGEKEEELKDLKSAIFEAIKKYNIEGIVSGSLFSNYQRKRIEMICDDLGIKCYSPLWHMNQEKELKLLLDKGFKFIFVKVAADGLDESWLGKEFNFEFFERLRNLNKKNGLNIAGEGGEYESLVLFAPFFKKEIKIKDYTVVKEGFSSTFYVKSAFLNGKP